MIWYHFGLSIGLAYVSGFRAYFPLLLVGIIGRFADKFPLQPPFRFLTALPVLLLLIVIMGCEIMVERIPGNAAGHILLPVALKAAAGGILFAGLYAGLGNVLGFIFGAFAAVSSHFLMVHYGFPGEAPGFSSDNLKDVLVIAGTVLILLLPWLSIIIGGFLLFTLVRKLRQNTRYIPQRRTRSWR